MALDRRLTVGIVLLFALAAAFMCPRPALAGPVPGTASSVSLFYTTGKPGYQARASGVAVDSHGNVYVVCDGYDAMVIKLDPAGNVLYSMNMPPKGDQGYYSGADHVAVDGQDNVYVMTSVADGPDSGRRCIAKLDSLGNVLWNKFNPVGNPDEMAVDSSGNIYTIVNGGSWIEKLNNDLTASECYVSGPHLGGVATVGNDLYYTEGNGIYRNEEQTPLVRPSFLWNHLALDEAGFFYQSRYGTIINRIDPQTGDTTEYATGFANVSSIATDKQGRLFVTDHSGTLSGTVYVVMPPLPDANHSTVTVDRSSVSTDETATATVTLENAFGCAWAGKQVSLEPGSSDVEVTPLNNGITDANGVATFTIHGSKVESGVTIVARDVTDNVTLSQTVRVSFTVGAAAKLAWGTRPGNGAAGVALPTQPIINLVDAHGNVRTGDSGDIVTLTAAGGAPLIWNTATVTNGVATFTNLMATKAGTYSITASLGGGIADAASDITIVPGKLGELRWVAVGPQGENCLPPTTGTQGQPIAAYPRVATLALYDSCGNFRATDSGTLVQLMASDGEFLSGNQEKAVSGVVRFPNLASENSGTFTLRAVAYPQIYSAPSAPIFIAPATIGFPTTLESLQPGMTLTFAGHNWTLVDPSTGFLIARDPIELWVGDARLNLTRPFDSGVNPVFDPGKPASIAYYLNETFLKSLPAAAQGSIKTHTWTTGANDGQGQNREATSSVDCKIGLISRSEFERYKERINWASEPWWTRTPSSYYWVWTAMYDELWGEYDFDELAIRPALYLDPHYPIIGADPRYPEFPGFPAPELLGYPMPSSVSAGGTTTLSTVDASGQTVNLFPNVSGDQLMIRVSASPIPRPNYGDPIPAGVIAYRPGDTVTAAGWDFLGIYEIDNATNTVRAFTQSRVPKGANWVRMSKMFLDLAVGGYEQLTATYQPSGSAVNGGTWRTSDPLVARVSATGLVTPVGPGVAMITLAAGESLTATCTVTVSANALAPIMVNEYWSTIPLRTGPVDIDIPADVTDASLSPQTTVSGGQVTAILPQVTATTLTSQGNIELSIANTTRVSGPLDWNGTINLPTVINNPTIPGADVDIAIEVGFGDTPLTLSQPIRIVLRGQAYTQAGLQRYVGFTQNGIFQPIPFMGTNPANDNPSAAVGNPGNGYLILGNDVIIWTEHCTTFVAYTPASEPEPAPASNGTITLYPSVGGTARLNDEATITVPANGLSGNAPLPLAITRVEAAPQPPLGQTILKAYEVAVAGGVYRFQRPATLTFGFDKSLAPAGLRVALYAYDSAAGEWKAVAGATLADGTVTAEIELATRYAVMSLPPTFTDVPVSHWGYASITSLAGKGILLGDPDGRFQPDAAITRAEFVAMLVRALGLAAPSSPSAFVDVAPSDWFAGSVAAAVDSGLVTGVGNGRFAPNAWITRQEMAVIIARALGNEALTVIGTELSGFTDAKTLSDWATAGMEKAVAAGIIDGVGNHRLAPRDAATRAAAATMIQRLLGVLAK